MPTRNKEELDEKLDVWGKEIKQFGNIITLIGSVLTILGVVIAYFQRKRQQET